MKLFKLYIYLFSLLFSVELNAQNTLDALGLTSSNLANVAFSVRQLSTNYTGPLMRVKVGSLYYDVYPDASSDKEISLSSKISTSLNSFSDATSIKTSSILSSLNATDASVAIWYDQSGIGNHLKQSNSTNQPKIIEGGTIIKENSKPFIKWTSIPYTGIPPDGYVRQFLSLTNPLSINGQVIVVNKFATNDDHGFLLGDNNLGSYYWHSDPHVNLLIYLSSFSNQNGLFFQNGSYVQDYNSLDYNHSLKINSIAPVFPNYKTYWDNIGSERNGGFHNTTNGSGYSELLSFATELGNTERKSVESSQASYYTITISNNDAPTSPFNVIKIDNNVETLGKSSSGNPSSPVQLGILANNLNADLVLTSPTGFEISTDGNTYSSTLTVLYDPAKRVALRAPLYIRMTSLATNGISGNLTATISGTTYSQYIQSDSRNVPPPEFNNVDPNLDINICMNGSYFLDPSTTGNWQSSDPSIAIVDTSGYVTAISVGDVYITLTDENQNSTSVFVHVVNAQDPIFNSLTINDPNVLPNYKFLLNTPQGPQEMGATINYVGYNGFTYASQTRPSNTGYYRASKQVGNEAGCPVQFYIIKCDACVTTVFVPNILIGSQYWMDKNLDVTTYRNGDPIPEVTNSAAWANLTTGAWCYYNNDPANGAIYGKLYNWYAVNDTRGLAPEGWHIPSDAEWTTLGAYLGGIDLAGGKMKTTGTTNWNTPNTSASNSSGFAGLPGGLREVGNFYNVGDYGNWWSATVVSSTNAWYRNLHNLVGRLGGGDANMGIGFSVRLIKD